MKRMLMAIMAVAVAVTFSAPSFANEPAPKTKETKEKGTKFVQMLNADEKKKEEKPADKKK